MRLQWRRAFFHPILWLLVVTGLVYINMSLKPNIVNYKTGKFGGVLTNLTSPELKAKDGTGEIVKGLLPILNELGRPDVDAHTALNKLSNLAVKSSSEHDFLKELGKMLTEAENALKRNLGGNKNPRTIDRIFKVNKNGNSVGVNVAVVGCGAEGAMEAEVLIKSAVLFSMDANHVHLIIFTDPQTISVLLTHVMKLKWTANLKFTVDFTFEFHLTSVPNNALKSLQRPRKTCATQRLFFPSLLPHVDSLIYMDADTIIVSNVSRIWEVFGRYMTNGEMAAMTSTAEYPVDGHYDRRSRIPYYGKRGVQSGVILMNLTRMREFEFETKAINAYKAYKDRMILLDQDIYNIIFHYHPEMLVKLDCSHNFRLQSCSGKPRGFCNFNKNPSPYCLCFRALEKGVQVLHGVHHIFQKKGSNFIQTTWKSFNQLDLAKDSPMEMVQELKKSFAADSENCWNLTADATYSKAELYLQRVLG